MVTEVVAVHPLASVIVNVWLPAASPVCAGVIVYPGVPPLGVMTTDPLFAPLQVTSVTAEVAVIGEGSVMVTEVVAVHPLASVIVNVWLPAASPVCAGVIVYPGVPPLGVMTTDPLFAPLQVTLVGVEAAVIGEGSVMVTEAVALQPLASVT